MRRTDADHSQRLLIFGNGGTGKTRLAREIGTILGRPAIHLDDLRWMPGQYGIARDNQLVVREVIEAAKAAFWLMEGVYGWLANVIMDRVTTLIWIDLPDDECIANIMERGTQGGGRVEDQPELIQWVREYRVRENSSTCYSTHLRLFEGYAGNKLILRNRTDIAAYTGYFRAAMAQKAFYI